MAGASIGTDDRRLTLGKRTSRRTALKARTMDAGGIELFWSRRVSVRLSDGGVNACSDLRDGRVQAWFGLVGFFWQESFGQLFPTLAELDRYARAA